VRRVRAIGTAVSAGVLAMGVVMLSAAPALAASVSAVDFRFVPSTITISAGETVTWTNNGQSPHTVTGGSFDSGNLNPGQTYSHTFSSAGTFPYHCQYHQSQGMVGTVIVTGGGGGGSSGPPTTLPNTGLGQGSAVAAVAGAVLLLVGTVILFGLRRRRA
jgi:LPXTG-motif cell wall-anchored protein